MKATVDAYDGTVTLYQVDEQDPVLNAWMGVFPDAVTAEDQISDELRSHFRYPEDLFKVQREMLAKYHVDEPLEFFTNNAFWSVPADPTVDTTANQPPYYLLMGDEKTADARFRLTSAMVGYNRQFLSAYISVEADPENYGQFTILRLPTDTQTFGPEQTQNAMISDTRVASERTLLERSNRIQYGNLLTLPIAEGGILYVQPMYTERNPTAGSTSTFPQLSRVLVSYREPGSGGGVRIGYAPTWRQPWIRCSVRVSAMLRRLRAVRRCRARRSRTIPDPKAWKVRCLTKVSSRSPEFLRWRFHLRVVRPR